MNYKIAVHTKLIPTNIHIHYYLFSATYDGTKKIAILKFYDVELQKIILWEDNTNHKPYCYSKLDLKDLEYLQEREDVIKIEKSTKNRSTIR